MNDVEKYLHNEFIKWLKTLRKDIKVSHQFLSQRAEKIYCTF
jgi:hypothetical protein